MTRALSRKNLWDAVPLPLRATIGAALGRVPPRYLFGREFRRNHALALTAQWWDRERSRAFQLQQLRRICAIAYETPYYRRTFDAVGFVPDDLKDVDDVRSLPTIDKHIVREHGLAMRVPSIRGTDVDLVSTGGSTGEPLRFWINAGRSSFEYAHMIASWERCGYELGAAHALLRGAVVAEDRHGLRHQYDPILRWHHYSNFHLDENNARRYLKHISTIGPCYLHAFPSSALVLARFIELGNWPVPNNILGLLCGSETVRSRERDVIERSFGVRMFTWYGHSEKLVLAAECEHSRSYHVWPTYGYCELLDDDGRPITRVGDRGQIVGTGFMNTAMPFVRYKTGDYATLAGERCTQCGRQQLLFDTIDGRSGLEFLIAADGTQVSMSAFNLHDDTFERIVAFQFRQRRAGHAVLCVVPKGVLSSDEQAKLLDRVRVRLQGQLHLELRVCAELERTASGKRRQVVREEAS